MQSNTTVNVNVTEKDGPNFGDGRYSPLMKEIYGDAIKILGLDEKVAEQLARNVAADVGAAMKNCPVEVRAGKMDKNGRLTLSEAAKMKNVTATEPIRILRALQFANESVKNGFNRNATKWTLVEDLEKYITNIM